MNDFLASFKNRQENSNTKSDNVDQRLIELSALIEISQTLNSSLKLNSILNNILLVPMGRMMLGKGIILLKKKNYTYRVENIKGLPFSLLNKEIDLPNLPQHATFLEYLTEESTWIDFFQEFKIELLIPFISRNETLGVMGFSKKINGKSFTDGEIEFLNSLTSIATSSIENALVFEEIQNVNRKLDQKIQELNTLFDIGKELNLTFEKDKILKLVSYVLMGQVTVNNFMIAMKEDETFYASLVKGSNFQLSEGERCRELCEKCMMLNKPYLSSDDSKFDSFLDSAGVKVVVPMLIQNEIKGFIFLAEKITKQPYRQSDLEFMQTLGNVTVISLENVRLFQETLEKKKLEEELALARNIQNRLLPKQMPIYSNILLHGVNVPSKFVGGDYFDVIQLDEHLLGITIADVSGKGMPASLLMSNLQASLHSLVHENFPIDKLVGKINNVIFNNTDPEKYITFFYGQLNLKNLHIEYVNAGHNPPYLMHSNGDFEELFQGGIILGMMPDMPYKKGECQLKKGDTLLLYTDGVTETMTMNDEEYEEKRLIEFMKQTCSTTLPEKINEKLIQVLKDFSDNAPQGDDITILTIQIPS